MSVINKLDKMTELLKDNGIVVTEGRTASDDCFVKFFIQLFLKNNIDAAICEAINYFNDNYKNFTKEDWFDFYEKHKNQPETLAFMLNNKFNIK